MRRRGHRHARKRVARLMRAAGLRGRSPRRFTRTTIPDPAAATRADLIRRDFNVNAAAANTRWCGEITYLATWEGWLYLATVIDIASRRVVGSPWPSSWARPGRRRAGQRGRRPRSRPWGDLPSDKGCQYTSADFATLAGDLAVILSTGRTGQRWDNALAESFLASLKGECLGQQPWPTRAAARRVIVASIAWSNGTRCTAPWAI